MTRFLNSFILWISAAQKKKKKNDSAVAQKNFFFFFLCWFIYPNLMTSHHTYVEY